MIFTLVSKSNVMAGFVTKSFLQIQSIKLITPSDTRDQTTPAIFVGKNSKCKARKEKSQ